MIIDNLKLFMEFRALLSDAWIHIFIFVVLLDIVTGITKGLAGKQGDSTKGLLGIVKHMLVTILVLFAYPYMNLLGFHEFAVTFVAFYIAVYAISITENWGQLGLPLPNFIKSHLDKLKHLANEGKLAKKNKSKGDDK